MGTASFTVGRLNRSAYAAGAGGVFATTHRTSGAHTTSGTASNIEDGAGDITLSAGEYIRIHADVAMWVSFNGTAAVGTGFLIPETTWLEWECDNSNGTLVSAIDA